MPTEVAFGAVEACDVLYFAQAARGRYPKQESGAINFQILNIIIAIHSSAIEETEQV
jgi:hypothetical protein